MYTLCYFDMLYIRYIISISIDRFKINNEINSNDEIKN